jgi:two-component system response regulator FixJ
MVHSGSMVIGVVDDDVDMRRALHRLLRVMGHEVRLFASAEEFASERHDVDCLILDIRLPGLNGLELREQLRASGRHLPLVFITGDADRFLGDGLPVDTPTLRKPFDEASLVDALSDAVGAFTQLNQ